MVRAEIFRAEETVIMNVKAIQSRRCAIYTRKSSEEGLEQEFNSLDAQRDACEAYIRSQRHEGWELHLDHYDDGGFSGGNIDRPALKQLLADLKSGQIDIIVVYKIDRLSRSLSDFVRLVEVLDKHAVSFVSVTQQFNTSTSMGRLTLNMLLSFAQFEREVTGERIRDKFAASIKKGIWMGGVVPMGYVAKDRKLHLDPEYAKVVHHIFTRYLELKSVRHLKAELDVDGYISKRRNYKSGTSGGQPFFRGQLYNMLSNPIYIGKLKHHDKVYEGQHTAIIQQELWDRTQQLLAQNRVKTRTRERIKQPGLLAGIIFDDRGNAMSSTHGSKKKKVRYRYYVSQALLQYREREAGSVSRISAHAIEELVVAELHDIYKDNHRLRDILNSTTVPLPQQNEVFQVGKDLVTDWSNLTPTRHVKSIKTAISKVTIGKTILEIIFSRCGLLKLLCVEDRHLQFEIDEYIVRLPVNLQRCGIESKLIVEGRDPGTAHKRTINAIQDALHKALKWNQMLITGQVESMKELAISSNVTQRYIAHIIKLAWLSPEIMQAIFSGQIPPTLSLGKLKKGFPLEWSKQPSALGFTSLSSHRQ
mgnify:CR=1 FL=1